MKKSLSKRFIKDAQRIKDEKILAKIRHVLKQIEIAENLSAIENIEELTGYKGFYRIKFDYRYRIGIYCDSDSVQFLRVGQREDFYKKFP